ncbi:MAG: methyltransferase domain-containing protein [Halobacteriales archaeon]|nr:methyltransferase domain-containing protein [Halobacteriales archaeon]
MHEIDRVTLVDGSYQHSLLRDAPRVEAYAKAIASVVRPGDVVADLGSGSGILGWLALQAGAARVHAVEAHRGAAANLERLVRQNGVGDRVRVQEADAERWLPPEPVDVAMCELMETGLLHEAVAGVMRQVHAWPAMPRAVLPAGARLFVEAVELRDAFHGWRAPLPGWRGAESGAALTEPACYAAPDFLAAAPPEGVDWAGELRATRDGRADALRLRTETQLAPGIVLGSSPAYCNPVVLPLPEALPLRAGQRVAARLRYGFAFTAEPLRFALG